MSVSTDLNGKLQNDKAFLAHLAKTEGIDRRRLTMIHGEYILNISVKLGAQKYIKSTHFLKSSLLIGFLIFEDKSLAPTLS